MAARCTRDFRRREQSANDRMEWTEIDHKLHGRTEAGDRFLRHAIARPDMQRKSQSEMIAILRI